MPRIVKLDDATGRLMVDGQPTKRKFALGAAIPVNKGKRKPSRPPPADDN